MRLPNAVDQKGQLYILAVILLAVLFLYFFIYIALYYCPKNNVNQEKGEEGNQTGVSNPV